MGFANRFLFARKCLFSLVGVGAMVVFGAGHVAQAQFEDDEGEQISNDTGASQSQFTEVFQGNVQASDSVVDRNPFSNGSVNVTTDGSGNTNIVYSGDPVSPGGSIKPKFGLNGASSPPNGLQLLSQYWGASPTNSVPIISLKQTTLPTGSARYAILYMQASPGSAGDWLELPYPTTASPPSVILSNDTAAPFTLSNSGFMLSPTMIPLDNLNFNDLPPPGNSGSQFTPLPDINGSAVQPGVSETINLPEPASMLVLGLGAVGLMGRRRRIV